ncbi:MAG: HAD family hydrolase [Desulfuromonadaceae bacterium]|nr:HAD family hydrolase [Desulfuromonadaceae bacterium]
MDINTKRVFIFDVNGVLVLSNVGNAWGMAEAFTSDPKLADRIVQLYWQMGGLDRGSKIRLVQDRIIRRPFQEEEFELRWERFRELSSRSMMTAPLGRGCREVLACLGERGKVRVALSNTPPGQLDDILKKRCLDRFFDVVRGGGDWPKSESLARLLKEEGFQPGECLFLADGRGDLEAARLSGVDFVGINDVAGEFAGQEGVSAIYSDLAAWGEENLGLRPVD